MSLTLGLETIDEARASGLDDMLQLNWEEVETDQTLAPLAINWPAYYSLERSGVLKPLMLRKDGTLIGYSVWFLQPTLHHKTTVWAINDEVYVDPAHRARAGVVLLRKSQQMLEGMGAKAIIYNVKPADLGDGGARANVAPLLHALGYSKAEEAWVKYV